MRALLCHLTLLLSTCVLAQEPVLLLDPDDRTITTNQVTVNGQRMDYRAETGTQPVWDDDGRQIAYLHYTYYRRLGQDSTTRPLIMSFNGGPGSASCWMHLAYTGPRILNIDDEGYPVQPYGFRDNPHSVLDVADIVYINPVNTGYSRVLPQPEGKEVDRKTFFGINADIKTWPIGSILSSPATVAGQARNT